MISKKDLIIPENTADTAERASDAEAKAEAEDALLQQHNDSVQRFVKEQDQKVSEKLGVSETEQDPYEAARPQMLKTLGEASKTLDNIPKNAKSDVFGILKDMFLKFPDLLLGMLRSSKNLSAAEREKREARRAEFREMFDDRIRAFVLKQSPEFRKDIASDLRGKVTPGFEKSGENTLQHLGVTNVDKASTTTEKKA